MTEAGPPVIFPELAGIPIYHNRALWPFVTAYALRAARVGNDAEFAAESARSLIRGAALSLSNMENFEFLTQQIHFDDGLLSGPVINSPRQLWSVAGYLNMVLESFWGLQPSVDRLIVKSRHSGRPGGRVVRRAAPAVAATTCITPAPRWTSRSRCRKAGRPRGG
jgi:glycogen debranching enzyme